MRRRHASTATHGGRRARSGSRDAKLGLSGVNRRGRNDVPSSKGLETLAPGSYHAARRHRRGRGRFELYATCAWIGASWLEAASTGGCVCP